MSASLLPPNATALERALAGAIGTAIAAVPTPVESVWDPDTCPAHVLPWLAYGLSIDDWSPDWPELVQRERIRRAIAIQRHKGTIRSIRDVVAAFGGAIALREWWQTAPRGTPHTFSLVLSLGALTGAAPSADYVEQVITAIRRTKPVRSHFTFTQALAGAATIGTKAVGRAVSYARLSLSAPASA